MRVLYLTLSALLFTVISVNAQTVDYPFIRKIVSQSDSASQVSLKSSGYTAMQQGEFQYIKDNRIYSRVYYMKGFPEGEPSQRHTYWAFQIRGKDDYSDIFKMIKKGAVKKEGTRLGKAKTEYKAQDGMYYYPFEDSSINHLYWIYASKESLLD